MCIRDRIEGATRVLINSPKVATYDLQPEMSAYEVKDALIAELDKDIYDVVIVNFANCDMVGHTGIIPAAIKADVYKRQIWWSTTTCSDCQSNCE